MSDNLAHDTVAVHEYQKIIINYLKISLSQRKSTISLIVLGNISRIKVALLISKLMKKVLISQQNGTSMAQLMAKVRVMA